MNYKKIFNLVGVGAVCQHFFSLINNNFLNKGAVMNKLAMVAQLALCFVFVFCNNSGGQTRPSEAEVKKIAVKAKASVSTFKDDRDGKTYKKVTIGGQTWMAENLNYEESGSVCYKNSVENCEKYGRLYNWYEAFACPSGWHLPSDEEWTTLVENVHSSKILKSKSGWNKDGNGTDDYEFSALPGGCMVPNGGGFSNVGYSGYWWTARLRDGRSADIRNISYEDERVKPNEDVLSYRFSVRCVQD